ncbi:MAG: hypothetical protein IGS48_04760 [Oscillatoriales cyanobacterium C42_A2020_001]|nr:hypothetical protein [Leptolyngbyaceae cyanobacterium C42_A2020_001]
MVRYAIATKSAINYIAREPLTIWNSQMGWKFWLSWFLSNSLIISVSFALLGMWEQENFSPRYFARNSPSTISCLIVAIMLGGVQWLILRAYREDICEWWVVTYTIGFPLSACVSLILHEFAIFSVFNEQTSDATWLKFLAESGAIGGFVGGFVIGFVQGVGLEFAGWIPINAVAWAAAWAAGLVLGRLFDYIAVNDSLILGRLPIQLGFLGLGLGVVSSFITGFGLVWLSWQRQHTSRGGYSPHR